MKKTVSIIVICGLLLSIGTVSVFADTATSALRYVQKNVTLYTGSDNKNLQVSVEAYTLRPYYSTASESGNSNAYCVDQQVIINYRFVNSSTDSVYINSTYCDLLPVWTYHNGGANVDYMGVDIETIEGNLFQGFGINSGSEYLRFRWGDQYSYNGRAVIPGSSIVSHCISLTYHYNYTDLSSVIDPVGDSVSYISDLLISNPKAENCSRITNYDLYNQNYNSSLIAEDVNEINENVQAILDAYTSNSQIVSDVNDNADGLKDNVDTVHDSEATWFAQNSQAISASGLSNYNIPTTGRTGLTTVGNLFNDLWTNIGVWKQVYIFSMTISLAMLILRHAPQRRKRSGSGGRSDVSSG